MKKYAEIWAIEIDGRKDPWIRSVPLDESGKEYHTVWVWDALKMLKDTGLFEADNDVFVPLHRISCIRVLKK